MRLWFHSTLLVTLVLLVSDLALGDEKKAEVLTDQQFGRLLTLFLEDPLHEKGKDIARMLVVYTMQTPKAAVMMGENEMKWIGKKEDNRSLLLFAAYLSGNTRSQLLSGFRSRARQDRSWIRQNSAAFAIHPQCWAWAAEFWRIQLRSCRHRT